MRAVVKVKQSQGREPSNAARYIAESKLDSEREGNGQRPLFTNRGADKLAYGDANRYLKDGRGRPAKGDLIHFSVSFQNEDFERLGATDDERKELLREAAREAMEELKSDLRIADWRWVAGIHLNTKNPHIHVLIYKEITDDKGKQRRLGKIPKRLLPRREQSSDGETRSVEGAIGGYFVAALDRASERAREADRERQEAATRITNERLEAGAEINKEIAPPSSKPLAEPDPRDPSVAGKTAGQLSAIRIVNKKHFKGGGAASEVYIGRAMTGIKGSALGNPYRIGRDGAREEVIEKYDRWLSWEIVERGEAYRELQRLADIARTGEVVMVCWCAPEKCHGEIIKSEIEAINHFRNRELEAPDMSEILSHSLEFDTPLVYQGIEYRTVENFYQAMRTAKDDLNMRRQIATATPDEARQLGAQIQARHDWPEIRREVMETALKHKFAPGTKWHARLRATGDTDILDGSRENYLGNLLMSLRESRERVISSDEILLEANRRNPSLAGRELVQELILRGLAPEPVNPPEALGDIREALKDRRADDPYYSSRPEKADWLGEHSQELRGLYERGATIKDKVLVIPAEGHELNNLTADREPFINELRYAHQEIPDHPEKANEFYKQAKAVAGKTANTKAEIDYFRYFYKQIKHDGEGRYLKPDQKEAREEALDRTLIEMRALAGEMEKLETLVSVEARRADAVVSLEQVRETEFNASYSDEDQERLAEGPEIEPDFEFEEDEEEGILSSEPDTPESEREIDIDSFVFNTAARKVNLSDERFRFPAGLTFEDRKSLIETHLPNVDAKIEAGKREVAILGDINRMVEDWNRKLAETGAARQKLSDKFDGIGYFLKAYARERLKDPETRALNTSEAFRNAHERIAETRTPEELNRAARAILKDNDFSWRERALLFFGRAPAHHTPEMRELRHSWGLSRDERAGHVRALGEEQRAPSLALDKLLAELETRTTARAISHYRASVLNDEMRNPGKLDLRALYERLPAYERDYLYKKIEERTEALAGKYPSLYETAPQIEESLPSRDGESLRMYLAELKDREQSLLEARQPLSTEERRAIHDKACNQAWDRLALPEMFAERPTEAARLLSDTIAELQEKFQPQARLAAQVLDEFSLQKTGYPHGRIPEESLAKLSSSDLGRLNEMERFATAASDELYRGFERIDLLRFEIEMSREGRNATSEAREQASQASRETETIVAAKEASRRQTPARAGTRFGEAPRESRSYREYTEAVAEIERQLLDEAIRQKQPTDKGKQEIAPAEGLLTREEKLEIRAIAAGLAWERLEPREILTSDPAVIELLSLGENVARLRDEAQPLAREAAGKLDEFIRSRKLDEFAIQKTDYYYRADQIPKDEIEKLSPADKLEFASLEGHAGATFREFKEGFRAIDKIRTDIDQARDGSRSPAPLNGERGKASNGKHIDRSFGPGVRLQDHVPNPEQELKNDRIILGNAIIAHARADSAALDYEIARDHGRTFRFKVHDESVGAARRISDLDVHRRAGAHGDRVADERGAARKEDRLAIRGQISEADIQHHSTTLEEHGKKLDKLVSELESKANSALDAYQHARRLAAEVVEKYQKRGDSPPAPFVKREVLVKTQDETIERRFAGHTERLERLRVALAEEHGQPLRDDREAARLVAQLFTAHTELQAREEHAARFDETRHLRRWEIQGEKLSLADVSRLIEQATDKAQFVGKQEFHIFPDDRRRASAEVERLGGIRQEIIEKTVEKRDDMRERVNEAGKFLDALTRAHERETLLREQAGLVMPNPQFTRQELDRIDDNIETTRDAALLRQLSVFERKFNAYADPKERFESAEGWGRAPARALVAEIFHHESAERMAAFRERGSLQPLLIETSSGLATHRLKDTEPRSLIEMLARPIIETPAQREARQEMQAAFAQYESWLQANIEKTHAYLEAAREIASSQAAERSLRAGQELPAPEVALSPKRAMIVEIHAERQTDPEERGRLLALARGSAQSHFDSHSHSHTRSSEPVAREIASGMGRGR